MWGSARINRTGPSHWQPILQKLEMVELVCPMIRFTLEQY